jgi:hypothetical protein
MSSFGIRPRFTQTLDLGVVEAQARLARAVEDGAERCEMKVFPSFICLRIPEQDRHFWSPRLNLEFEGTEDGKTRIEGIYGPNANVSTSPASSSTSPPTAWSCPAAAPASPSSSKATKRTPSSP